MKSTLLLLIFMLSTSAVTAAVDEFTMPLGIPIVPGARLAISDAYDVSGG
ncbi:hypothetical protein [Gilvimarinus japonicus]|uniref:Uncharacterized protein n=1 Tax=Gilvimarinus japonicus TaxID=1796469 RepID=A0ABV7HQU3_9GAMM